MTDHVLGEATDADGLIEIYRRRKDELGLTNEWFDEYSGLARGHVGKLLGDARAKNLGATTLHALNCSLAVKFLVVIDLEQTAIMQARWEMRERPIVMRATASKRAIERFLPIITRHRMKTLAPLGGRARAAKMTPKQRSKSARKAARARWNGIRPVECVAD